MRIPLRTPATRRDCVLDAKLTPEQKTDLSRRLDDGLSLAEAARELLEQPGIAVSTTAISRWAAKRRRVKSDETLARFFELVETDAHHARRFSSRQNGPGDNFLEANLLLASRALFAAQCSEDAHGMLRAIKILAAASGAAAQTRRADAAQTTAGARHTLASIAQQKLADEHARAEAARAAEAEKIRQQDPEVRREKMERIIERTFGKRPQWSIDAQERDRKERDEQNAVTRAAQQEAVAQWRAEASSPQTIPAPGPAEAAPEEAPPEPEAVAAPARPQPSAPTRAHPNHTLVPSKPRVDKPISNLEPWLKPGEWYRRPPPRLANR